MYSAPNPRESRLIKCLCHLPGREDCVEKRELLAEEYRRLDIEDATDSVMKVMRICGLKAWEVKRSSAVIQRSFKHFEEVRERIDRVPRKRFSKESFMHGLAQEGQMSRMDAQLAYAIVKRAFKAFYYGTGLEGTRYYSLMNDMTHMQECIWLHAARRTAEIHAAFTGMMYSEELQFEERIECVYKSLHDVLQSRILWVDDFVCSCTGKETVELSKAISRASIRSDEVEVLYLKTNMAASSAPSGTSTMPGKVPWSVSALQSNDSSRHNHSLRKGNRKQSSSEQSELVVFSPPKCRCPHLRCCREWGEARESPDITAESSQGPYICRWIPFTEDDEEFKEHCVAPPPMEVVCPPCHMEELSCDSECICTCQVCTCQPAFDGDGYAEEEHLGEKLSGSGVEDYDTDFCWLAPFRGSSKDRVQAKEEVAQEEEEERGEEEFQCPCTCRFKQWAKPHLFTYLAPFREVKKGEDTKEEEQKREPVKKSSSSEHLLSRPPPPGITLETYRCWVRDKASSTSASDEAIVPPLFLLSPAQKSKAPEFQVTIKQQHGAPPAPPTQAAPSLPKKPAPAPEPSNPPLAPVKPKKPEEDKLTKEDILDIIGLRVVK
ncbi:hypothetical protein KR009_008718 [Drosophila setifemur]|nr:hypothetical protein KR009_008718 [Drosophila setifemur]